MSAEIRKTPESVNDAVMRRLGITKPALSENKEIASIPTHFNIVVVLGKNIGVDWSPSRIRQTDTALSPHSERNAQAAAKLYNEGVSSVFLFSTGQTAGKYAPSEAQAMADHFDSQTTIDNPNGAVLLEQGSLDTWGNAREVARFLKEAGMENVLLVTNDFHMDRAAFLFAQELRGSGVHLFTLTSDEVLKDDPSTYKYHQANAEVIRKEIAKERTALKVQRLPLGKQFVSIVTSITRNPNR